MSTRTHVRQPRSRMTISLANVYSSRAASSRRTAFHDIAFSSEILAVICVDNILEEFLSGAGRDSKRRAPDLRDLSAMLKRILRRVAERNYYTARVLYLRRLKQQQLKYTKPPVLVFTMEKLVLLLSTPRCARRKRNWTCQSTIPISWRTNGGLRGRRKTRNTFAPSCITVHFDPGRHNSVDRCSIQIEERAKDGR